MKYEVLNIHKQYLQSLIDKGQDKLIYNEFYDEKIIDIINSIDEIIKENEEKDKLIKEQQEKTLKFDSHIIARKNKIIESIENRIIKELNINNYITDNLTTLIEKYNEMIKE